MTYAPNTFALVLEEEFQIPTDPGELREFIALRERLCASIVNSKESGSYELIEIPDGQFFFTADNNQLKRPGFRLVFNRGGIAPGAFDTFTHGITNLTQVTDYWGIATTTVPDFRKIPYASSILVTNQVSVTINSTNVVVTNGATAATISSYIFILEYLKN
jgi:hypothetical protein